MPHSYASLERDSQRETFPFLRAYLRSQARGHRRLPRQAELDEKIEELAQLLSSLRVSSSNTEIPAAEVNEAEITMASACQRSMNQRAAGPGHLHQV